VDINGGGGKDVGVCRGVLRFWRPRIQDSRTDFGVFLAKMVDSTSTRGWCKTESSVRGCYTDGDTTWRWKVFEFGVW
jgi:hypothetical protein